MSRRGWYKRAYTQTIAPRAADALYDGRQDGSMPHRDHLSRMAARGRYSEGEPMVAHRIVGALLICSALLAWACGGSDKQESPGGQGAAPDSGGAATPSSARRQPNPGADRLFAGLLSVSDMPQGWARSRDTTAGNPEDTDICTQNLADLEQHRQKLAEASIGFDRGESGPFLAQTLAVYPPGVAQQVMDNLGKAIETCREVTVRDEEGASSLWQLTRLTAPELGDQALAFREYQPANLVEAQIVYIRKGDYITVMLHIAINSRVDRTQTDAFASRAYERLLHVAGER